MCQIKCPVQLHFFLLGEAIVVIKAPARHFVKLTQKDTNLNIKPVLNIFYCFYKITSSKNYNAGKDFKKIQFTDQNVSSYNFNLTMA